MKPIMNVMDLLEGLHGIYAENYEFYYNASWDHPPIYTDSKCTVQGDSEPLINYR